MHISSLHIFAKNRDASEIHRGYAYQDLKTLETWLKNRIDKVDEDIYCDYEDDIFQRNLKEYKATFRQLKLYTSKTFSLTSEEIQKAISHFFQLFAKGEYLFDTPIFQFETNTGVARQYGSNEADLLKAWSVHQGKLTGDLLQRCIQKSKSIVHEHFAKRVKEAKANEKESFSEALSGFEALDEEIWSHFVNSIRWVFTDVTPEQEIDNVIKSINTLIGQLQFSKEDTDKIFAALYREVSMRSIATKPENRCLTSVLLDHVLLNLGDNYDKQYLSIVDKWRNVADVQRFSIGEFYEVLHAAKYCRRKNYLEAHSQQWIGLLSKYIALTDIPPQFKREAIYELIWVTIRPTMDQEQFKKREKEIGGIGYSAKGNEQLIQEYFANMEQFDSLVELQDTITLLPVVGTAARHGLLEIAPGEIYDWTTRYAALLDRKIANTSTPYELCHLHENNAFLNLFKAAFKFDGVMPETAFEQLGKIIPLLDKAERYPVYELSEKFEPMLSLYAKLKDPTKFNLLQEFLEKLQPYVDARSSNFSKAKKFTKWAIDTLTTGNPTAMLKAISHLHTAKKLYFEDQSIEGHVLALLNISQFYLAIGLNFAAKYYALTAIIVCKRQGKSLLYKKISEGNAFTFLSDFQNGAWINALYSANDYGSARDTFTTKDFDWTQDELLATILGATSTILGLTNNLAPSLKHLVDDLAKNLDFIATSGLQKDGESVFSTMNAQDIENILSRKLSGIPFNDVGQDRSVSWKALGIEWRVTFPNDFINNSLGEEFCSLLQITHAELALNFANLPYAATKVNIQLKEGGFIPPEITQHATSYEATIYLHELVNPSIQDSKSYYAHMSSSIKSIFNMVIAHPKVKVDEIWRALFEKHQLNETGLTAIDYQNAYRQTISDERFIRARIAAFTNPEIKLPLKSDPALNKADTN